MHSIFYISFLFSYMRGQAAGTKKQHEKSLSRRCNVSATFWLSYMWAGSQLWRHRCGCLTWCNWRQEPLFDFLDKSLRWTIRICDIFFLIFLFMLNLKNLLVSQKYYFFAAISTCALPPLAGSTNTRERFGESSDVNKVKFYHCNNGKTCFDLSNQCLTAPDFIATDHKVIN